ncbi:kinase-like domain-containing protein [Mycena galopus ATCC 62051]|nr:kinase-like domain-containing protein [Mycena galopus ATCC 62051]
MDLNPAQTKFLVYEDSLSFLQGACNAGRSPSEAKMLWMTVDCIVSMTTDNVVSAIVESLECRKRVLEISNELDLTNEPNFRAALRADEERIAIFLVSIFNSKSDQETVLRLEGDQAQHFLDVAQETLDRGFLVAQEHAQMAIRIIRKLSESCELLPTSLFIVGVNGRDEHPSFGGGFGDIYSALYRDQRVAVKRMRHFLHGSDLRCIRLKFGREALLWKNLHHPNILPFLGIDRCSFPSFFYLVSPWMEHGTVINYLQTHGFSDVDKLLYQIAQGLEYLHSRNIVHGDLRGTNILIQEDWSACLADFGLSTFADATATMSSTRAGSLYWMAPELLLPERFGLKFARTPATDVYAFGCVCIELYTGSPPFSACPEPAALMKVLNGERPERPPGPPVMTDILWQHITDFWAEDPTTRPSTELVVQNVTWQPSTPSASLTAGSLPGSTPPATNELLSSAVFSTAEETAILERESSIPSLADTAQGIGTQTPPLSRWWLDTQSEEASPVINENGAIPHEFLGFDELDTTPPVRPDPFLPVIPRYDQTLLATAVAVPHAAGAQGASLAVGSRFIYDRDWDAEDRPRPPSSFIRFIARTIRIASLDLRFDYGAKPVPAPVPSSTKPAHAPSGSGNGSMGYDRDWDGEDRPSSSIIRFVGHRIKMVPLDLRLDYGAKPIPAPVPSSTEGPAHAPSGSGNGSMGYDQDWDGEDRPSSSIIRFVGHTIRMVSLDLRLDYGAKPVPTPALSFPEGPAHAPSGSGEIPRTVRPAPGSAPPPRTNKWWQIKTLAAIIKDLSSKAARLAMRIFSSRTR